MGTSTRNYYKGLVYKTGFFDNNEEPTLHVGGEVTLVDSDGTELSLGGGSSSGGNNAYTTASGQYTATANVGTKTITITGLPFTLSECSIVDGSIKKIDASGNVTILDTNQFTISGSIITLPNEDDFVTDDEVCITLVGPDKAYDTNQDVFKHNVENPEWDHYTSIEHIIDVTNGSINTYFIAITVESYRNMVIQLGATDATGAEFKIYGTLDEDAAVPATGGTAGATWIEMTNTIFGGAVSATSIAELAFIDTSMMPERYLIEYTLQNATNTVDTWIRKY